MDLGIDLSASVYEIHNTQPKWMTPLNLNAWESLDITLIFIPSFYNQTGRKNSLSSQLSAS